MEGKQKRQRVNAQTYPEIMEMHGEINVVKVKKEQHNWAERSACGSSLRAVRETTFNSFSFRSTENLAFSTKELIHSFRKLDD